MSQIRDRSPSTHDTTQDQQQNVDSESSYMVSDDSTESSRFSTKSVNILGKPRKRKLSDETIPTQSAAKRLRLAYNDKYRELYNTATEELSALPIMDPDQTVPSSQIGMSVWTAEEKEVFFEVLAWKGRHNIKAIAVEIGSKSEPEVSQYIKLLRKSFVDCELQFRRPAFLKNPQLEAASELSPDCVAALDLSAEALAFLQQKAEEKIERKQHGHLWLLTYKIAKWADECLRDGDDQEGPLNQRLPAAILLNLGQFLHLSKRFFLNSCDRDYNWQTYKQKREVPGILYTAFSDFHTLAVSVTKRLIQSSNFFAMSRLRASQTSHHHPKQCIRRRDVLAALDVLGMKRNAKSHWAGMARRCKLQVFEKVRGFKVSGQHYTYAEVEQLLGDDFRASDESLESHTMSDATMRNAAVETSDSQPVSDTDDHLSDDSDDPMGPVSAIDSVVKPLVQEEAQDQLRDEYMETIDQMQSQAEEERLWRMLGENSSTKMKLKYRSRPRAPVSTRVDRQDLVDWTTWIDYGAEWETLESPARAEAFQQNRRIGKAESKFRGSQEASAVVDSKHQPNELAHSMEGDSQEMSDSTSDEMDMTSAVDTSGSSDEVSTELDSQSKASQRVATSESEESDDDDDNDDGDDDSDNGEELS